jgi:hypothetical protein
MSRKEGENKNGAEEAEEVGKEEAITCCGVWSRSEMESSWKSLIL